MSVKDPHEADGGKAVPVESRGRVAPVASSRAISLESVLDTYVPALILALGVGIALPAIPSLARSFHVSFGVASGVVTSFLIGGTLGTLPTGWLIDRIGRRKVMLAGPLLTAVVAFMVAASRTFPELIILRFFDGWAAQMWLIARMAGISARAAPNQRGRQVSWMFGMDNVGRLSGPLAGGFIATAWGLRAPFLAYGVLALIALIPGFMFAKDYETRAPRVGTSGEPIARVRISIPRMILSRWPFFGVCFFAALARGPIQADLLHLYAAFQYHLTPKQIGFLATGASSISLPIGFLAGWWMDRFGRKKTMVPGFVGVTLTTLLIAMTAWLHLNVIWYIATFLPTVAAQALTGGSIQTVGADVAPPEARGMFLGIWRFTGQAGTAISPVMFAFLASVTGYVSSFLFVAACAGMVAFLLLVYVPETGKPAVPPL